MQTFERMNDGVLLSLKVGGETIRVTPGHPFWVVEGEELESRPWPAHVGAPLAASQLPGRWVDAGELRVGDVLYLKSGELGPIEEIRRDEVWEKVYNFQVEELECYAVGGGGVLVHNSSTACHIAPNKGKGPKHGGLKHDRAIKAYVKKLPKRARDVRKNQAQVNAKGEKVGDNRPDIQWTDANGRRHYVEIEGKSSGANYGEILRNDPAGVVEVLDLKTGTTTIINP